LFSDEQDGDGHYQQHRFGKMERRRKEEGGGYVHVSTQVGKMSIY
jgi:hypothetical protein